MLEEEQVSMGNSKGKEIRDPDVGRNEKQENDEWRESVSKNVDRE